MENVRLSKEQVDAMTPEQLGDYMCKVLDSVEPSAPVPVPPAPPQKPRSNYKELERRIAALEQALGITPPEIREEYRQSTCKQEMSVDDIKRKCREDLRKMGIDLPEPKAKFGNTEPPPIPPEKYTQWLTKAVEYLKNHQLTQEQHAAGVDAFGEKFVARYAPSEQVWILWAWWRKVWNDAWETYVQTKPVVETEEEVEL